MRELTICEFDLIPGGDGEDSGTETTRTLSEYAGATASAACGYFARGKAKAACGAIGLAIEDYLNASTDYVATDPMDTKLGINGG